jgi:hypothetical protein
MGGGWKNRKRSSLGLDKVRAHGGEGLERRDMGRRKQGMEKGKGSEENE